MGLKNYLDLGRSNKGKDSRIIFVCSTEYSYPLRIRCISCISIVLIIYVPVFSIHMYIVCLILDNPMVTNYHIKY